MNTFFIALLFFGLSFSIDQDGRLEKGKEHKVILSDHSELVIKGKTNVNQFSCDYLEIGNTDTIHFKISSNGKRAKFFNSAIRLKVVEFDCGSGLMNKNFKELLKVEENPNIMIEFLDFNQLEPGDHSMDSHGHEAVGYFDVSLEVAGVRKEFKVPIFSRELDKQEFLFLGEVSLDIRDFGLVAPEKMMGMVKVDDEIFIELKLAFSRISS